jgi:predicted RNase H-like HicB family nuclease
MGNKYEIIIYWDKNDCIFIAEIPELKGCIAHGETDEEALQNVKFVALEWLKIAKEEGWPIPEPKGKFLDLAI